MPIKIKEALLSWPLQGHFRKVTWDTGYRVPGKAGGPERGQGQDRHVAPECRGAESKLTSAPVTCPPIFITHLAKIYSDSCPAFPTEAISRAAGTRPASPLAWKLVLASDLGTTE
jgi:hypothetical protein